MHARTYSHALCVFVSVGEIDDFVHARLCARTGPVHAVPTPPESPYRHNVPEPPQNPTPFHTVLEPAKLYTVIPYISRARSGILGKKFGHLAIVELHVFSLTNDGEVLKHRSAEVPLLLRKQEEV